MPQKLRNSCNPCHFAKTKCIKATNGCQRCESTGEKCEHSPALPRVYQKRRSRKSLTDQSQADMPLSGQALEEATKKPSHQQTFGSASPLSLTTEPHVSTAFGKQSFNIAAGESNQFFWPFMPDSSLMGNPLDESSPVDLDLWQSGNIPPGMIAPATPMTISQGNLTFSASTAATKSPKSPKSQQDRPKNPSANSASDEVFPEAISCSCFPGLLAAMQDIDSHVKTSASALDTVLCANRTAAKHCVTSLKCEYGIRSRTSISCVAIASGLLDRMLASYKSALESYCADLEGGDDEDDQSEMEEDEDHTRPIIMDDPMLVKLGKFTVEKSEQVLWVRNIVAREIAKIQDGVNGCTIDGPNARRTLIEHVSRRCSVMIGEFGSQKET